MSLAEAELSREKMEADQEGRPEEDGDAQLSEFVLGKILEARPTKKAKLVTKPASRAPVHMRKPVSSRMQ